MADPLEVWGGPECSRILIQGRVRDQLTETGHREREDDLDRAAALGLHALRQPLLWTHAARDGSWNFAWAARRLARLERLGLHPIVGLLHHGWGPGSLTPCHADFAPRLAEFAEAVARRFPFLDRYTPINEPVTTARFAYLYGHWHPHARDEGRFLRAVASCASATAEAMRRVRRVNPEATLVQTEDVGRVFATPPLAGQADYENERRFLGFDLLSGRVDRGHRFYAALIEAGVEARALDGLAAEPCPPDVIGVDQYLTSDRFLDHEPERHPGEHVGGNGRQLYVDVAAVHVPELRAQLGFLPRLRELHARYGSPIALTEVHAGCTREEQLRWLMEAWDAAQLARAEGIAVRAVTVWALFGSHDWNSLMTREAGHYEVGAFDARTEPLRPTALAHAAASLARAGAFEHPLLARPGWWRRDVHAADATILRLAGSDADVSRLAACCTRRRIDAAARTDESRRWGEMVVSRAGGRLRFTFRRVGGEALLVAQGRLDITEEGSAFDSLADSALDLAIDEVVGRAGIGGTAALAARSQSVPASPLASKPRQFKARAG